MTTTSRAQFQLPPQSLLHRLHPDCILTAFPLHTAPKSFLFSDGYPGGKGVQSRSPC